MKKSAHHSVNLHLCLGISMKQQNLQFFGMDSNTFNRTQTKKLAQEKNGKTQDDIYCAVHCGQTSPKRRRRK